MKGTQANIMSESMTEQQPNPYADAAPAHEAPQQVDYFGFQEFDRFEFPDGVTYIEFKKLNEGEKARFQKSTSRDVVLERGTGNARMKADPGADRHALLEVAIVDWNLKRQGVPVPYNLRNLKDFLTLANPKIVEDIELAIRKANPWLMAEMTLEDIDREIDNLKEMRAEVEKRESGK